ncbi:MAG: GTPase [Bellilinea sp.]
MSDILGDFKDSIDLLFAKKHPTAPPEESDIVNIMLSGITGVGKSTLVNAVFGEDLAKTGVGAPVTQNIAVYEKDGVPLRVYDVRGLELNPAVQKSVRAEVKKLVRASRASETTGDDIHLMWYCVSSESSRLQDDEIAFINDLAQTIDVVLVITKSSDEVATRELMSHIETQRQEGALHVKAIVPVLAVDKTARGQVVEKFGLEELADLSYEMLPDAQKRAFAAAQRLSADLRKKAAFSAIALASAAAAATGAIPIPIADAAVLVPIQLAMFEGIARVYGVSFKQDDFTKMVDAVAPAAAVGVGKAAAGSLVKLIPGVGSVIYGSVAATLTAALGAAFQKALESGASQSEIDWDKLGSVFKSALDAALRQYSEVKAEN